MPRRSRNQLRDEEWDAYRLERRDRDLFFDRFIFPAIMCGIVLAIYVIARLCGV